MKSRASIKGHPIHPILVTFPIAFFFGAFISDVFVIINDDHIFNSMAKYLEIAGIGTALLAAIPGILDYLYTVPPKSSANKRATQHGLLNITLLMLFSFALLLRQDPEANFIFVLLLESAGIILLTLSGWLGGTLVNRNQIGIDHRYANAGKWKEETIKSSTNPVELKSINTLKTDQMKLFTINGKRIVIGKTESEYVAFEDSCTHRGGSLADGVMVCETVQCPWHGTQYNVKTGNVKAGPAKEKIKIFKVEEKDGKHYLYV